MAQDKRGAAKTGAKRLRISLREYTERAKTTKHCWKCSAWKAFTDFGNDKSRYDGLATQCKCCRLRC